MRKFKLIATFIILSLFMIVAYVNADTEVGGNITENTTWSLANSPYILTSTVQVLENVKLIIEAGIEVKFSNDCDLNIGGELNAIGTDQDKIIFTSQNGVTRSNSEIMFIDSSKDAVVDSYNKYLSGSILKYCEIRNIERVYFYKSSPFVSQNVFENLVKVYAYYIDQKTYIIDNVFQNNEHGVLVSSPQSKIYIENNIIRNNKYGIVCGGNTIVKNNVIESNTLLGIQTSGDGWVEYNVIT